MENNLVTQEWLDAHADSTLKIGDVIPEDAALVVPPPHEIPVLPNLEKERDERVAPVVQGVIEDLSGVGGTSVDVNDRSEFTNIIISVLKRTLAADLNVTTDNPYVFQLVLTAFGAFNQFVISCKMSEPEDKRYSKVAHEMMTLFASAHVPVGMDVKNEDQIKALETIRPQMEEIFAREMLTKLEITYILEGLLNAVKVTQEVFSQNVEDSLKRLEAKILDIPDMTDLTMKKLDWGLTSKIEDIIAADKGQQA